MPSGEKASESQAYVSRRHKSAKAYVSIRQQKAYVSIRQHTSAYVRPEDKRRISEPQRLLRQYLYFCTSKASKACT